MEITGYIKEKSAQIDTALKSVLPPRDSYPELIHEAMHYSIFAGGKRLRPALCIAAVEALGEDPKPLLPAACALEMVHTYSLIHDDLPAMDNDDYRRGKLTNHKIFGEGIAILAGDALLTQAFEVMAGLLKINVFQPADILLAIHELARASGSLGMVGGQTVDLDSEGKIVSPETLSYIHNHKTGALFKASLRMGALLYQADTGMKDALTMYADNFGLAFQITDDLLDVLGDEKKIGKPVGSDIKNHKVTYPSLYGLERSKELALSAVETAISSLKDFPGNTEPLISMVRYLLNRES